jgi:hypothetical protein
MSQILKRKSLLVLLTRFVHTSNLKVIESLVDTSPSNRLVDITFAATQSVDSILSSSYCIIPSLSKVPIHIAPPKSIPILNPFELCIGSLNDYKGLHEIIEKWLYYKYIHDDSSKSTCIFDTCLSHDHKFFIFMMDSWESTLIILRDTQAFCAYFTQSPFLTDPKLLFKSNSSGFAHKSTTATIDASTDVVNDTITKLKVNLVDFHKGQNKNNNMVQ